MSGVWCLVSLSLSVSLYPAVFSLSLSLFLSPSLSISPSPFWVPGMYLFTVLLLLSNQRQISEAVSVFASRLPGRSTPRTRLTSVFGKAPTAHLAWVPGTSIFWHLVCTLPAPSGNSPDRMYVSTVLTIKREKGRSLGWVKLSRAERQLVLSGCCYCSSHVAMEYLSRALCAV